MQSIALGGVADQTGMRPVGLAYSRNGIGYAAWTTPKTDTEDVSFAVVRPGQRETNAVTERAATLVGGPTATGASAVVLVSHLSRPVTSDSGRTDLAFWQLGSDSSVQRKVQIPIPAGWTVGHASMASSAGRAIAAWVELRRGAGDDASFRARLRTARLERDGELHGVRTMQASSGVPDPLDANVAAAASGGRVLIAADSLEDRGSHRGIVGWVGSFDTIGDRPIAVAKSHSSVLSAVVTSRGVPVIAWAAQHAGEEADGPWTVRVARLTQRSATTAQLDRGTSRRFPASERLDLLAVSGGRAVLVWNGVRTKGDPVFVATSDADGRFGSAANVVDSGRLTGTAASARGELAVTVMPMTKPGAPVLLVRRTSAKRFLPALTVPLRVTQPLVPAFDSANNATLATTSGERRARGLTLAHRFSR
ncbi:MAG: hypothetical protein J7513_08000 [Solirubrobacteraceae bacterium]|nr:hypothetical protein [Solirubrobacteraceae bacterium]